MGNWSTEEPGGGERYFGPRAFIPPRDCLDTIGLWGPGADDRAFEPEAR